MRLRLVLAIIGIASSVQAHDIPDERVDRAIQVTLRPGRVEIDYEVSLAELTLAQDLRRLVGVLPDADRAALFDRYGRETAPLNAKGLIASVGGGALGLVPVGFELAVEGHPRYTFHYAAELPGRGRLVVEDTNYLESLGTSRLAIRGDRVAITGDDLPGEVDRIEPKPSWMLSDDEERRARRVEVGFGPGLTSTTTTQQTRPPRPDPPSNGLSALLDRMRGNSLAMAWLLALGLGMAHSVQPGHGKTLVAAAVAGRRGRPWDGVALACLTTLAHTGSVLVIALALWATRSTRYVEWNNALARAAGFTIAAVGFWRLGRHLGGYGEHDDSHDLGGGSLLGLGLAGGLVPCWDAVLLVVLAEATGRMGLGLVLLSGFSLGMAIVLIAVGLGASMIRGNVRDATWERRLGFLSGLALAAVGLYLLATI